MTVAAVGLLKGFHKHHITPKHLGGSNDPSNLVLLHPYDHAIAHYVRWKIFKTDGDAWAFNKLKGWLDDGALTVKGMRHTDEAKAVIGVYSKERVRSPHSEETRLKISVSKKGVASNRRGATHTQDSMQKMSDSHLGQEPWNKGLVGVCKAWNKGKAGVQKSWNKGQKGSIKWSDEAKARHSEKIKQIWANRKQEVV
jgi:hypothetical protein